MSLRLSFVCLIGLLLGCTSSDLTTAASERTGAGDDVAMPTLRVEGPLETSVLPNGRVDLKVRYEDPSGNPGALAGIQVDFALTGVSPGASLMPWRAVTDATGLATTTLFVGSMPGTLQVRAGAPDAQPVYMRVDVREALDALLTVQVAYPGKRDVSSYTVTALTGMKCAQALSAGIAGDVVHRFSGSERAVEFEVAPDLDTAIVGWGRDESGGQLARGCIDFRAPITASEQDARSTLTLTLSDTPIALDRAVPLELELSVLPATMRLADAASAAVEQALATRPTPETAEADYYLEQMARAIASDTGKASAFAAQRASLTTSLAGALSAAEVGPRAYAAWVGALFGSRAAKLQLRTTLADTMPETISQLRAVGEDGTGSLELMLKPGFRLDARFDPAQAKVAVTALRIELGVGDYGTGVLAAFEAARDREAAEAIEDATGCADVVGPWAYAQQSLRSVCGRDCAVSACRQAIASLRAAIGAALPLLAREPIALSGTLHAHDRDEDGSVDDVGPDPLTGTWGAAGQVACEARVPQQTTLTL